MSLALAWMPPQAPYMPIATAGLLSRLQDAGYPARARWDAAGDLSVETEPDVDGVAELIAAAPWPAADRIAWPDGKWGQGLKPTLGRAAEPMHAFRAMLAAAPPLEQRLLRAIATDGVLEDDGMPGRSRLLRGVKADLSSVFKPPKTPKAADLASELRGGPNFRSGSSGYGLGLVPEVQTFGGTTGPDASTVGAHSPLLYRLLWHGLMALPPIGVRRGWRRVVGGPLVTRADSLSWPVWRIAANLDDLRVLFNWSEIHADTPNGDVLQARGVDAVFRARTVKLSTTVAVFRWGERVA